LNLVQNQLIMEIQYLSDQKPIITLIKATGVVFSTVQNVLDVMVTCSWNGADIIVIEVQHLIPEFFDLKTGIAGEMLQKFSNYRLKLGIVGDFSEYKSNNLHDFIRESNSARCIVFADSVENAIQALK
jgi:hypothetical protein